MASRSQPCGAPKSAASFFRKLLWRLTGRRPVMRINHERLCWGALWISESAAFGRTEHLLNEKCTPALFRTRAEARAYIAKRYGWIADREDLRAEPHGWRMPRAVRVSVTVRL